MIHQLENKWVLWESSITQTSSTIDNKELYEFETVEDFWKCWLLIPRPSEVFNNGHIKKEIDGRIIKGFCLFKKGIKPEWEDPANSTGSRWICRHSRRFETVVAYWENLVYGLVGETIDERDEICGCRIVNDIGEVPVKLELWLRTGNKDVADRILTQMLNALIDAQCSQPGQPRVLPNFEHMYHVN